MLFLTFKGIPHPHIPKWKKTWIKWTDDRTCPLNLHTFLALEPIWYLWNVHLADLSPTHTHKERRGKNKERERDTHRDRERETDRHTDTPAMQTGSYQHKRTAYILTDRERKKENNIHTYVHTYIHTCTHTNLHTHTHTHTHTRAQIRAHTERDRYTHTQTETQQTDWQTDIHTNTHTHTHVHTHANTEIFKPLDVLASSVNNSQHLTTVISVPREVA